jgi:hypothetical protein
VDLDQIDLARAASAGLRNVRSLVADAAQLPLLDGTDGTLEAHGRPLAAGLPHGAGAADSFT